MKMGLALIKFFYCFVCLFCPFFFVGASFLQGKDNLMRIFSQKLFRCDTRDFLPFVFSEARDGLNRRVKGTPVGKHIWGLPKRSIGNRAFSFQNQWWKKASSRVCPFPYVLCFFYKGFNPDGPFTFWLLGWGLFSSCLDSWIWWWWIILSLLRF